MLLGSFPIAGTFPNWPVPEGSDAEETKEGDEASVPFDCLNLLLFISY
jgi:hypothetical protein